jgi:hypothetical protein
MTASSELAHLKSLKMDFKRTIYAKQIQIAERLEIEICEYFRRYLHRSGRAEVSKVNEITSLKKRAPVERMTGATVCLFM